MKPVKEARGVHTTWHMLKTKKQMAGANITKSIIMLNMNEIF